jgi:hypothetical protein
MAARFEDQPWHQEWREVLDRVIAAEMARDRAKLFAYPPSSNQFQT